VRQGDTGDEKVFEIVVPEDSDPTIGRISPSSPIGKCLLGNEEGDTVEVRVPAGRKEYEITKLVTIHDQVKDGAQGA
jgi:transcription elongation factor GreA